MNKPVSQTGVSVGARLFSSDNAAGIHPAVLAAINAANEGHALAYGKDRWTERAVAAFRHHFGDDVEVAFTFGGTGANVVGLATLLESHQSVICAESSHLWRDECGAPERWLGSKLSPVATTDGKLRPDVLAPLMEDRGVVHRAQPGVVTVTQATEWGTVYGIDELRALGRFCLENDLFLHVDGARLANAAAALGATLGEVSGECGVDVLCFGGTKNGLLGGEAVVVFPSARDRGLEFKLKQAAQLASKMRFVAAQFEAILDDDLWLRNARQANAMASELASRLAAFEDVELVQPVQSNALFLRVSPVIAEALRRSFAVSVWKPDGPVVRVMTSFDTAGADLDALVRVVEAAGG
jgi:threonine aldolase